ncbi:MAG: hypothetical protein R3C32_14515 [Chloroflexota bacterium]
MSRAPRPDDLFRLRVPLEAVPSPDGRRICLAVKEPAPDRDGYRTALWIVPADGSAPERRLTLGARRDGTPRWSPDGSIIAFLSDRAAVLANGGASDQPSTAHRATEEGHGEVQVWLLPMDGGEARQLTRLPEDVQDLAWSPDGSRLCLVSAAVRERGPRPSVDAPRRDARITDRLMYQLNGQGFIGDRAQNLWTVDVGDGTLRRLTSGASHDRQPAWSPDGRNIAFTSDRHADPDLSWRSDVYVIPADGGRARRVTGGRGERVFDQPSWSPDGGLIAATGHRYRRCERLVHGRLGVRPGGRGPGHGADRRRPAGRRRRHELGPRRRPGTGPRMGARRLVARVRGAHRGFVRAVAGPSGRRHARAAHPWRARAGRAAGDRVGTGPAGGAPGRRRRDPVGGRRGGRAAPRPARRGIQVRTLTRLMSGWADIDLVRPATRWHESDGRRIRGGSSRRLVGTADRRPWWSRSMEARPRSMAGRSCGSGSAWWRRGSASTPATARVPGVWRGAVLREHGRLGRRAHGGRHDGARRPGGRQARRPGAHGRHGRLVRRLSHRLDRGPPSGSRRRSDAGASTTSRRRC